MFQGCFFHGCPHCMKPSSMNRKLGRRMDQLFQQTQTRGTKITQAGYLLKEMWECQWVSKKRTDRDLAAHVDRYEFHSPLKPRECLYGGRTNAVKLHHQVTKEAKDRIFYYDIRSLYPYVNARSFYPVGHPDILISQQDFQPIKTVHKRFRGLFKCHILPPRQLYLPVLPMRTKSKRLVFPLCKTCAEELNQDACTHTDKERTLCGAWPHVEVRKAIEKGYRMVHVDEIWEWKDWTDTLFKGYIQRLVDLLLFPDDQLFFLHINV